MANLKTNRHTPDENIMYGTWKKVHIGVMKTNGKIVTIFADINQSKTIKKRKEK